MSDALRAALAADEDTPAGIDVAAVRTRAVRLRRTRYAATGAAVVTALAVLVPVAVVQRDRGAPIATGPVPELVCPDRVPAAPPDRSGAGDLLPGPATEAQVCRYAEGVIDVPFEPSSGTLAGEVRLTPAEAATLAARLRTLRPLGDEPCSLDLSAVFAIQLAGPGWARTLRVETYGCGLVSNGTVTKAAGADKPYLTQFLDRAGR